MSIPKSPKGFKTKNGFRPVTKNLELHNIVIDLVDNIDNVTKLMLLLKKYQSECFDSDNVMLMHNTIIDRIKKLTSELE